MVSDPMELVQVNHRIPRFLKLAIESAAKIRNLSQEQWFDEAINSQLAQDSEAALDYFKRATEYIESIRRQKQFTPSEDSVQ